MSLLSIIHSRFDYQFDLTGKLVIKRQIDEFSHHAGQIREFGAESNMNSGIGVLGEISTNTSSNLILRIDAKTN